MHKNLFLLLKKFKNTGSAQLCPEARYSERQDGLNFLKIHDNNKQMHVLLL